jgi:hypothetical protein
MVYLSHTQGKSRICHIVDGIDFLMEAAGRRAIRIDLNESVVKLAF